MYIAQGKTLKAKPAKGRLVDMSMPPAPAKGVLMKAYSCCDCFDYSLSNKCLEHICSGSEEARSAFILPHSHSSNKQQKNEFSPRSTNRYQRTRAFSNNCRTLSLTPRGRCIRNHFTSTFILPYQEDCGLPGQQIRLYMEQFFLELSNKTTIKIRCAHRPGLPLCIEGLCATLLIPLTLQEQYI